MALFISNGKSDEWGRLVIFRDIGFVGFVSWLIVYLNNSDAGVLAARLWRFKKNSQIESHHGKRFRDNIGAGRGFVSSIVFTVHISSLTQHILVPLVMKRRLDVHWWKHAWRITRLKPCISSNRPNLRWIIQQSHQPRYGGTSLYTLLRFPCARTPPSYSL